MKTLNFLDTNTPLRRDADSVCFLDAFKAGCLRTLRLFEHVGVMPTKLDIALQKRELEKKLVDSGYPRKLAQIAVAEAFASPAKLTQET